MPRSSQPLSTALPGTWELISLAAENVGQVLTREMAVDGDQLVISVRTTVNGEPVTRTLTWRRVG
jgi:hypothetical protein